MMRKDKIKMNKINFIMQMVNTLVHNMNINLNFCLCLDKT